MIDGRQTSVLSVLSIHEGEISKHSNNYDHGIARRSIVFLPQSVAGIV